MLAQVEEVLGLAVEAKLPAGAGLPNEGRTVAPRELVDQALGPEMLVDVHTDHGSTIAIKLIDLIYKAERASLVRPETPARRGAGVVERGGLENR